MSNEQDIQEYIERYAKCRGISIEAAKEHLIVKEYIEYKNKQKPTKNELYYH